MHELLSMCDMKYKNILYAIKRIQMPNIQKSTDKYSTVFSEKVTHNKK